MTTTQTNSTVSAEQAMAALDELRQEIGLGGTGYEQRNILRAFIAQHSDVGASSAEPVAAGWRLLEVGEMVRNGDEYFNAHIGNWFPCVLPSEIETESQVIRRRFAAQGQSGETK